MLGRESGWGRWYGLVQHNDVALFEVLDEGMQVLEVETAARVIAALWVRKGDRSLSNGKFESGSSGTHELVFTFHGRESLELLLLSLPTLLLARVGVNDAGSGRTMWKRVAGRWQLRVNSTGVLVARMRGCERE